MLPERVETVEASYLHGLREARARHPDEVLCVLWLGSSVGNLPHEESSQFFRDVLAISGPKTEVLVCTDLWKDVGSLHAAYCDSRGVTEAFIKNGLANALGAASGGGFQGRLESWDYDVVVNGDLRQVEMYLIAGQTVDLGGGISFKKGERVLIEVSRKFTTEHLRGLAYGAGFYFQAQWKSPRYSIQMLCSPQLAFELAWRDTDRLFARVQEWGQMPIELRHPFCFYYGHVASFAKTRLLKSDTSSKWDVMFSRGIDPDVADPSQCHDHPDAPTEWPNKEFVIEYVTEARRKMSAALEGGASDMHAACMALEHEYMHHETLCYMLAQQQKRDWRAGHLKPDGAVLENGIAFEESMARWAGGVFDRTSEAALGTGHAEADWVAIPGGSVTLGTHVDGRSGFVWDNEGPLQEPVEVKGFSVAARPVSVAEYRAYLLSQRGAGGGSLPLEEIHPSTWTITADGDLWVHYPEGTSHWTEVSERPVWCSLAQAQAYATSIGCRVMSEQEYSLAIASKQTRVNMLQNGGWEWTGTPFRPFAGFEPASSYEEYSADFFDDKHFVLMGGSPYTHPSVQRPSFRNFYQGIYPHMFAKFRCCR